MRWFLCGALIGGLIVAVTDFGTFDWQFWALAVPMDIMAVLLLQRGEAA